MLGLQQGWGRHLCMLIALCGIFAFASGADAQQGNGVSNTGLLAKQSDTQEPKSTGDSNEAVPAYRKTLVGVMDKLFSELESILKEKGLTFEQKKQKALEFIRVVRWGPEKKDYFWVFDLQGKMLMDPYIPDLVGKDLSNFVDPNGNRVFAESIKILRESGQGFIEFLWPKYEGKKPVPKVALVRLLREFGIGIGTGIYIDTIEAYEVPENIGELFIPIGDEDLPDDPASPT